MICSVENCGKTTPWGKLCPTHYYRKTVYGRPDVRIRQDPNKIWSDGKIGYIEIYKADNTLKSIAIIDAEDIGRVQALKWGQNSLGYAQAGLKDRGKIILMHRFIKPSNTHIDHKNGDKLDNRKSNLRKATRYENARNRTRSNPGYKGVYKSGNGWIVRVWFEDDNINIGTFHDEVLAAHIYNDAASQLLGRSRRFIKYNKV